MQQRRRHQHSKNTVPRTNLAINQTFTGRHKHPQLNKSYEDLESKIQVNFFSIFRLQLFFFRIYVIYVKNLCSQSKFKENRFSSPLRSFNDNDNRTLSDEKLNRNYDSVIKNSRQGLRSVPHYEYTSSLSES